MLTPSQEKILKTIIFYYHMFGYSPSIRDIANLCGYKSTSTVHAHLQNLKQKGCISIEEAKARTIKVLAQWKVRA